MGAHPAPPPPPNGRGPMIFSMPQNTNFPHCILLASLAILIDISIAQTGVFTDQLCRAIYCIHLTIMPITIAIPTT